MRKRGVLRAFRPWHSGSASWTASWRTVPECLGSSPSVRQSQVVEAALQNHRGFQSLAKSYQALRRPQWPLWALRAPRSQVRSRIKSPQSLMKKLLQGGLEPFGFSALPAGRVVNDLLGLEVIVQPLGPYNWRLRAL